MSISSELQASARSTYRALLRSAAFTFSGDERVYNAFRVKIREEMIKGRSVENSEQYKNNVQHWREVAEVLRKNFVQGERIHRASPGVSGDQDIWRLRMTSQTELGSNDTVKLASTSKCSSTVSKSRNLSRVSEDREADTNEETKRLNFNVLKRLSKERKLPELREDDLEESFVRGSGPGGQSINKTQNNVQILHKPTGIRISCQETRSLHQNRAIARRILIDKLDQMENPGLSKTEMARAKKNERERQRKKKARKKQKERNADNSDAFRTEVVQKLQTKDR